MSAFEGKAGIGAARIAWPSKTLSPNQMLAETYLIACRYERLLSRDQPEIWLGQCVSHYVFAVHFLPIIRKRLDIDPSDYRD